ncbi:lipase secretion chaperone [Psychromonas aquimarina]|uniref:lipase secretion chaperone n=1 Tax=Psychromonas aquimarina TaxID=444919 RepID=UPI00041D1EBA|nr:lipase secretion chaperone [Psychromonas aquimarina]
MRKVIAVSAAISLLSILFFTASGYLNEKTQPEVQIQPQSNHQQAGGQNIEIKTQQKQPPWLISSKKRPLKVELTVDLKLRRQFDHLIFQHQEKGLSLELLLAALGAELNLNQQAADNLIELFFRYQNYLKTVFFIKKDAPQRDDFIDIAESKLFLQQIYNLQFQYFSAAEIEAFFSAEIRYLDQALARLEIRQDPSLTDKHKKQLIEYQISQLSAQESSALQPTINAEKVLSQLISANEDIHQFNPEIQGRIEQTRKSSRQWLQKVNAYQKVISENHNLTEQERRDILLSYRQDHFTANEIKRLQVFLKYPQLLEQAR